MVLMGAGAYKGQAAPIHTVAGHD